MESSKNVALSPRKVLILFGIYSESINEIRKIFRNLQNHRVTEKTVYFYTKLFDFRESSRVVTVPLVDVL